MIMHLKSISVESFLLNVVFKGCGIQNDNHSKRSKHIVNVGDADNDEGIGKGR